MKMGDIPGQTPASRSFALPAEGVDLTADLMRLIRIVRERKSIVIGSIIVVTTLVALVTWQLTPRYEATTQILIDPRENQILDLQSVFSGLSPDTSTVESQVQVLKSRSLLKRVVEDLQLHEDPEFNPDIAESGTSVASAVVSFVNPLNWLPEGWRNAVEGGEAETFLTQEQTQAIVEDSVIGQLVDSLDVTRIGTSFAIDISFESVSPTKAARIANIIAESYIVDQLETKFDATRRATNWLNDRLRLLREELRSSEEAVEAFKAQHSLIGTQDGNTLNTEQLQEFNRALVEARTSRAEAEVRLQQIEEIYQSGGGVTRASKVINSALINQLREQESDLYQRESNLATRYQARHPQMVQIRNELRQIRSKINQEVERYIQELRNDVAVARAREKSLEGSVAKQQVRNAEQNRLEIQLRELELEADGNRQIYEVFLNRFKATTDQDSIQESDARIISIATVPQGASFPNKQLFVAGGFMASALLGIMLALIAERLDNGFRSVEQLESTTGVRNLSVVPSVKRGNKELEPHEYILDKPLSAYSESIRSIQNSVLLSNSERPIRCILTTSALPSEGKSTLSISLARLFARSGTKTILVDADLRRPRVREFVDEPAHERGLLEVLNGTCSIDQAILRDERTGLHFLTTKEGGADTPDLLNSNAMRDLLAELRESYEMVIVDAPPVLPVGDTKLLSRHVDTVVFVIRWERTPRVASIKAMEALDEAGISVLGTCLSQVDFERYTRYGQTDAGHYYGRYSNYYLD